MIEILEVLAAASSIATTIAVIIAAIQLRQTRKLAMVAFEDSLAREYRDLTKKVPVAARLGEELTEQEYQKCFNHLYRYFDLCNEQAFLHMKKRIGGGTWTFWFDGIKSNLERPAFKRAWKEICARSAGDFQELRGFFPPDPSTAPVEQIQLSEPRVIAQQQLADLPSTPAQLRNPEQ